MEFFDDVVWTRATVTGKVAEERFLEFRKFRRRAKMCGNACVNKVVALQPVAGESKEKTQLIGHASQVVADTNVGEETYLGFGHCKQGGFCCDPILSKQ